jgi:GntR family transcriptional regulator
MRRPRLVDLVVDKRSTTIPVYLQLKHHIVHLISSGAMPPGAPLPSVRQLAGDLGLATATIQRAYSELQEIGMLVGQAGRGVFVADLANELPYLPGERLGMLRGVFARAVSHALSLGFGQQEIVATVRDLVVGAVRPDQPPRVVFVGSSPETAEKYRALLDAALRADGVEVAALTLGEIQADADAALDTLEPIRCIVGLVRTFTRLRPIVGHRGTALFGLVVELTPATQRTIRALPDDEPIGLIAEELYLPSARTIVRQFRGSEANVVWAESQNRRAVRRVVRTCPTILHTFGTGPMLAKLAPRSRLIELRYLPTEASLDRLRNLVAPSPLGPRLAVAEG